MKSFVLLASLVLATFPAFSETQEAGIATLQELGRLNGQALACSEMAFSKKAKALMILHAPKTRRYGEIFEEATNASFLNQGSTPDSCPTPDDFNARLSDLSHHLQTSLPSAQ